VKEFLDGTNLQIDRGVTRLDGARGKKHWTIMQRVKSYRCLR